MRYLKKIGNASKKRDILASSNSGPEEEKSEGIGMGDNMEGAEIFEDFDKEKEKVGEWWLQKGVEEAVEEEPEPEEVEEWEEEKEAEKEEDKDDLIYSLREEDEEEEETDMALKTVMDEMGDVSAGELLELGRTALHEMGEERGGEEIEILNKSK